jgi:hypothetical protein
MPYTGVMTEYIATIKINDYVTGSETFHAADPAKIEFSKSTRGRELVTTRCGIKYTDPARKGYVYTPFSQVSTFQRCGRCEQLIAKENALEFAAEDHADEPAVDLLVKFARTLPADHRELPGVLRAIEVLKLYGQPLVHLDNTEEVVS